MSKTSLRRTLAQMTAPQLSQLIMDLYQARSEAKEYLDFFVNPDINRRLDRAKTAIRKELYRNLRGRNRCRSTKVKKIIKDLASLNPGDEPVIELMTYSVTTACEVGSDQWVKDITQKAMSRLLAETVVLADRAGLLPAYLPRLQKAVDEMDASHFYSRNYRNMLQMNLTYALDTL